MHNDLVEVLLSIWLNCRLLLGMTETTQLTKFCQLMKLGRLF